jgi:hypothetical protein
MFGLIEWICITDSNRSAKIPEIQKIITAKWKQFGYQIFIRQFIFRSILTCLLTLLVCFINATPGYTTVEGHVGHITMAVSVLYPFTLFLVVMIAVYQFPSAVTYGWDHWGFFSRRVRGAAKFEKILNTIVLVSFAIVVANEYLRHIYEREGKEVDVVDDPSVKVPFTLCITSAWLYMYYFLMCFDQTGPFVLTVYNIVSRDIPHFVTFYIVVVIAFACAISLLTNTGESQTFYGFDHLFRTFFNLIQITMNMQQIGNYEPEVQVELVPNDLVWVFNFFFTAYYIIVVLMFLNLLIAMINDTYAKLIVYDDALLLMEKYNIMCSMESTLWMIDRRSLPQSYSVVVHGKLGNSLNGRGKQQ